jgi:predicted RNA-binding protein
MAGMSVSPARPVQDTPAPSRFAGGTGQGDGIRARDLVTERTAKDDLKWYLMNKYRAEFTGKITREDLEELRYYLKRQDDPKPGWGQEYRKRFVRKMGNYMPEDILRNEIAGIASLLLLMRPEDLARHDPAILTGMR